MQDNHSACKIRNTIPSAIISFRDTPALPGKTPLEYFHPKNIIGMMRYLHAVRMIKAHPHFMYVHTVLPACFTKHIYCITNKGGKAAQTRRSMQHPFFALGDAPTDTAARHEACVAPCQNGSAPLYSLQEVEYQVPSFVRFAKNCICSKSQVERRRRRIRCVGCRIHPA